jgi:hypothetical protein
MGGAGAQHDNQIMLQERCSVYFLNVSFLCFWVAKAFFNLDGRACQHLAISPSRVFLH